jgi:hypothetical protein
MKNTSVSNIFQTWRPMILNNNMYVVLMSSRMLYHKLRIIKMLSASWLPILYQEPTDFDKDKSKNSFLTGRGYVLSRGLPATGLFLLCVWSTVKGSQLSPHWGQFRI